VRKEPFTVGSYVHVTKRGARGLPIVRDDGDRWRFMLMLRHFNDTNISSLWFRELMSEKVADSFERPKIWRKQEKIVEVLAYCLLDNHFHLLLREIVDGGISKFIQKVANGMSHHFNEKYKEKGSIFQGPYHSRTVDTDAYLQYVSAYIQVKNSFDMFPGGPEKASGEFESAYDWASKYPYSSLGEYAGMRESGILDKGILGELFPKPSDYKQLARDFMEGKYGNELDPGEYIGTPFE
jgi:putative transposase